MSTTFHTTKERFDDTGPDFSYRGYNYTVTIAGIDFKVRSYDNKLGEFTVIGPTSALRSLHARQLVEYLVSELGCERIQFYCGSSGTYRPVGLQTLEFI